MYKQRYLGKNPFNILWKQNRFVTPTSFTLLLSKSRPNLLKGFCLDVPCIAPVIARHALYWTFSNLFWKLSFSHKKYHHGQDLYNERLSI